jgi:hypothetical protein
MPGKNRPPQQHVQPKPAKEPDALEAADRQHVDMLSADQGKLTGWELRLIMEYCEEVNGAIVPQVVLPSIMSGAAQSTLSTAAPHFVHIFVLGYTSACIQNGGRELREWKMEGLIGYAGTI